MKSTAEKEETLNLCKNGESSDKLALKHINLLICASYLVTIVIALALFVHIHHVDERHQRDSRINLERLVEMESELSKLKDFSSEHSEQIRGWVENNLMSSC